MTDEPEADMPGNGRRKRTTATTSGRVNRVEINDEGVRVLVEIEGMSAIRAANIMQTVLTMAFPDGGNAADQAERTSVLERAGRSTGN